ncbi:MAG: electron transfer flavoprotein subunit beta/FixA family protein, partial [Candidatus Omnitrophica bacterium]|nr:electron transfer flavoprotein subunit beta/FixA family protein [Candidatus Omnitrophota bacterium]
IREGVASIINPFDMYAIEEGIRIKEKYSGKTIVLTMGPPQADSALREALSLGIDEAIHLCDKAFAGSDTWATSLVLAKAIEKIGEVDLVICGKQASDGDTAQVGPGISAHLNFPQATYVKKIKEISLEKRIIRVERLLEDGYEVLELQLPALLTVVKEINEPRMPSLRGKLKAKSAQIPIWTIKDLELKEEEVGLKGSPTQVVRIFTPPPRQSGVIFQGEPQEIAGKLVEELKKYLL